MRRGWYLHEEQPEVIAAHGYAEQLRHLDDKWELRGGSAEDRRALRE